jgi:hypothetical protein
MSNKKQTAVEWLVEQCPRIETIVADYILEQAKEMEKQQIEEAWDSAYGGDSSHDGEQYYKETYEQ